MALNEKLPEWKNSGAEPDENLKNSGFQAGYKPPAAYFNWLFSRGYNCIKEIQNAWNTLDVDNVLPLVSDITYWVSTSGSDGTGDGSQGAPFATVQKAVNSCKCYGSGHKYVIRLLPGEYAGFTVDGKDIYISSTEPKAVNFSSTVIVLNGARVVMQSTFTFDGKKAYDGIRAQNGAFVLLEMPQTFLSCTIGVNAGNGSQIVSQGDNTYIFTNCTRAINAVYGSEVFLYSLFGTGMSIGISVNSGSRVIYTNNAMDTATAESVGNASEIITGILNTSAKDVIGAINEHEADINGLNDNLANKGYYVGRGQITHRGEIVFTGNYISDANYSWDMPTSGMYYFISCFGTKGLDWNIPLLACGIDGEHLYLSMMQSADGSNYTNTAWKQII